MAPLRHSRAVNLQTFESLFSALHRQLGGEDSTLPGCLRVAGIDIPLTGEADARGEHLWICVDFGAVPEARAEDVYRTMLESNLRAGSAEAGLLALHPNGRAVLLVRHPLSAALDAEALVPVLVRYAALARQWVNLVAGSGPQRA